MDEPLREIIDRFQDPVLLIDDARVVVFANAAAQTILRRRQVLSMHLGTLSVADPEANERLNALILDNKLTRRSRAVRLRRQSASRDWIMLVSDVSRPDRRRVLIHLVGRISVRHLPPTALQDLFGLTRKEIDVLTKLMRYASLRVVAERMTLSHETIRAYVKRIFHKCEVRSQSQLIALLHRVSLLATVEERASSVE